MKAKIDPYTGEAFIPKRSNQKFATRENQIAYNNQKAKKLRDESRETNLAIKKNLKIYKRILKDTDSKIVSRDFLEGAEFNFGIFTQIYEDGDRKFYMTINYGYYLTEKNNYLLKRFYEKVKK